MKKLGFVILLLASVLNAGCQAIPQKKPNIGFSPLPNDNHGRVLVSSLYVPVNEPGVTAYYLLGALAGAKTDIRYYASVFDVTDGIHYIGEIGNGGALYGKDREYIGPWLEYDAPIGKRTLMLSSHGGSKLITHVDFIEVNIEPNKIKDIAISQAGFMRFPYLTEIKFEDKHRKFCSALVGKDTETMVNEVESYKAANNIDPLAKDFNSYCLGLAQLANVIVPNEASIKNFEGIKPAVETAKGNNYASWRSKQDKNPGYDLMHLYDVIKPKQSTGLTGQL